VKAEGGGPLKVPSSPFEPGRFIRIYTGGADIDKVARKRALKVSVSESPKVHAIPYLHSPQVPVPRKVLIKTPTSKAMDTAVHFVLDKRAKILIVVGTLSPQIPADRVATRNGLILQKAMAPFITDRAVMGVMKHEPFYDVSPEFRGFRVCGGYHHTVLGFLHAAHLNTFDRTLEELYGADTAGTHRPQGRMIAESRYHDAQSFSGLYDLCPLRDFYFEIVDDQFRHSIFSIEVLEYWSDGVLF
jgi:hypothetical protein